MKTRCKHPACPGYAEKATGFCLTHAGEFVPRRPFAGAQSSPMSLLVRAEYATTTWRKFTADYLKRHPICVKCGQPSQATDHNLMSAPEMLTQFGRFIYDERYYRALCTSCNTKERNRKWKRTPKG
jgi:5-methylcytosine-specific restriction enzyme A